MAEILTESFCERCGTRYTFESTAHRPTPFGVLGTVGRGIRNFVAMPDASLDEAFAVARAETEQGATAHQLEAFHQTFNFCLSCRQYTCAECWNTVEGRCLSCAPLPEAEVTAEPVVASEPFAVVGEPFAVSAPAPDALRPTAGPADLAWPTVELQPPAEAVAAPPLVEPEAEPVAEVEPVAEAWPVEGAEPVVEVGPFVETERESPAAFEPVEPGPPVEPEPVPEFEPEPSLEPTVEPEPEPLVEVEPETVVEVPPPAEEFATAPIDRPAGGIVMPSSSPPPPGATSRPAFEPGMSLDEQIAAYDLRMAALAAAPPPAGVAPPAPALVSTPIVARPPVAPTPAAFSPAPPAPRVIEHSVGIPEMPPAPEGAATPAAPIGTCPSCGLSLSASARFCRRCGTQQRA